MTGMARIEPLAPPYEPEAEEQLRRMTPPGTDPIGLFRTMARNVALAEAIQGVGGHLLSRRLSVGVREREIVIDRTTARCGCEYEWGVHVAFFGGRAGLSAEQVRSLTHGRPDDACWDQPRDRLLIRMADALHEASDVGDDLAKELHAEFEDAQLLDLYLLAGWYHAISFVARGAGVEPEAGAPRFADYA
jgi:alkylhydroperoxidase family enzyme